MNLIVFLLIFFPVNLTFDTSIKRMIIKFIFKTIFIFYVYYQYRPNDSKKTHGVKRNLIDCNTIQLLYGYASFYEFKTFLTSGNETKCWWEMKKGSTDELEVTVKPIMTGKHSLEIRILDRVVVSKDFESKPGKCSVFKCRHSVQVSTYITEAFSIQLNSNLKH